MPFSLSERVLFGLLAMDDADLRRLLGTLDRIELDPVGASDGSGSDQRGRIIYFVNAGGYRLYYYVARGGRVCFTELLG